MSFFEWLLIQLIISCLQNFLLLNVLLTYIILTEAMFKLYSYFFLIFIFYFKSVFKKSVLFIFEIIIFNHTCEAIYIYIATHTCVLKKIRVKKIY